LIEDVLSEQQDVRNSQVNLKAETITLDSSVSDPNSLANKLTLLLKPHGYTVTVEKQTAKSDNSVLWIAVPIGIAVLALFILLQKSGIVNLGVGGTVTPITAFIIGLVASVSSCLAVVGGLVLSLSATISLDDAKNKKPIILFHSGRLIGFAVLGGVLGLIGHAIGISYAFSSALGIIAAIVMMLLGTNLLGLFTKNTIALPSSVFSFFRKVEHEALAPLIVGIGTFFLPCGFTQSMQVAALSSGSVTNGSLIMLSFALGTLPMLGLLSFGAASFAHSRHAPLFFKSAGVFVIGLGAIALLTGLAGAGIIQPLFNL